MAPVDGRVAEGGSAGDSGDVAQGAPGDDLWSSQLCALGAFIRAQRQLADLSLREMAAITSVSNAYLSQIERGLHQPSLKVLQAISEALGLTSQELLSRAGFATEDSEDSGRISGPDVVRHAADAERVADSDRAADGDTERAVLADPRLSDGQKAALIAVYRSFVGD